MATVKRGRGRPPKKQPIDECIEHVRALNDDQLKRLTSAALGMLIGRLSSGSWPTPENLAAVSAFVTARKFM